MESIYKLLVVHIDHAKVEVALASQSMSPTFNQYLRLRHFLCTASLSCCRVKRLDVIFPLLGIRSQDTSIVRVQSIDLSLNIRSLGPYTAAASIKFDLLAELTEQHSSSIVIGIKVGIEFVSLVDGVHGLLDFPETNLLLVNKTDYHCYLQNKCHTVSLRYCDQYLQIPLEIRYA